MSPVTQHAPGIRVGDVVTRSAKGKRWIVAGFWTSAQGEQFADLNPMDGYTSASHPVAQLALVERKAARP